LLLLLPRLQQQLVQLQQRLRSRYDTRYCCCSCYK